MSRPYDLTLVLAILALGACASPGQPQSGPALSGETIAVSVGPCFGTCPVYDLRLAASGLVEFDGKEHTRVVGHREMTGSPGAYQSAARSLAAYRPARGTTTQTTCEQRISDQQHFTVVWTDSQGVATTLNHDGGCLSDRNRALKAVLQALPAGVGAGEWAAHTP